MAPLAQLLPLVALALAQIGPASSFVHGGNRHSNAAAAAAWLSGATHPACGAHDVACSYALSSASSAPLRNGRATARKSVQFGPARKHRKYEASTYIAPRKYNTAIAASLDEKSTFRPRTIGEKHEAALQIARDMAGKAASVIEAGKTVDFYVREDSYVDAESGLAHVYVKQTINGLVVEDGNLHVVFSEDGQLLQYSSSLYDGDLPEAFTNPVAETEPYSDEHCNVLRAQIGTKLSEAAEERTESQSTLKKRSQMVFAAENDDADGISTSAKDKEPSIAIAAAGHLEQLQLELYLNCNDPSDSPYLQGMDLGSHMPGALNQLTKSTSSSETIIDARLATLGFIREATTDARVRAQLSASLEPVAATISSTFEQASRPDGKHEQTEKLHNVPGASGDIAAKLGYIQTSEGRLNLVWRLEVPMDFEQNSNFYQVTADATSGALRSSVDWVSSAPMDKPVERSDEIEAQYKVMRWGLNDPSEGKRTLETGVRDVLASPYGWHSVPQKGRYDDTRGNNVIASAFGAGMEDYLQPMRPRPVGKRDEKGSMIFDYPFPWRVADKMHKDLSPDAYADASTVNLFYTLNEFHDLMYRYGFTPAAGNFEEAESSEGGRGGDAIIAYSISSAGTNNADFTTPPDGTKPRVRMYKWHTKENATERDGDFEAGIIIHEMSHGISTRLTGGPADSSCLGWGEAGGMGEGWGDFFATIIRRKTPTRDIYPMGSWASHAKAGIRKYPYSTNLTLNPETYKSLDSPGYWGVHAIGEVWAGMLYQVEEGLRAKLGWAPDLFPPSANASQEEQDKFFLSSDEVTRLVGSNGRASKRPIPRHGNTLAVQLIVDGMKLQNCRPSFFDARDAILQADKHLTGGAHACLIWERFAQRGLGIDAKVVGRTPWGGGVRTNGHGVPKTCRSSAS